MPTIKRGRPPLDPGDRSTHVHVRVSTKQYASLTARATAERCTVPELIRRAMSDRAMLDKYRP